MCGIYRRGLICCVCMSNTDKTWMVCNFQCVFLFSSWFYVLIEIHWELFRRFSDETHKIKSNIAIQLNRDSSNKMLCAAYLRNNRQSTFWRLCAPRALVSFEGSENANKSSIWNVSNVEWCVRVLHWFYFFDHIHTKVIINTCYYIVHSAKTNNEVHY